MADILLIQPPIRDFYLTAKRTIPYGLTCLAAVLIKNGFSVDILDALATSKVRTVALPLQLDYLSRYYGPADCSPFSLFNEFRHFGYSFSHIGRLAKQSGAFLVGISSLFTAYMNETLRTAQAVKASHPDCKIVIGGHHPTALPHSTMNCDAVDFILRGEAEVSIARLAAAVKKGAGYENVPGLVFRKPGGSLHINAPVAMDHPDHYPPPATHLIHHRFYRRRRKASMVVVASRGCPMRCSYCCLGASSFLPYRRRSVAAIMDEINAVARHHELGFIDFEDENLSLDKEWLLELLTAVKRRFPSSGPELRAMNGLFAPTLDHEVLTAMKDAGFKAINLSLVSTSCQQLKRFRRADIRKDADRVLDHCETLGLKAVAYVIAAAPFQIAQDSLDDLLYLAGRRVLAGLSIFYPAPGSSDFDLCRTLGLLPADFGRLRATALPVSHTTNRLQAVTLLRLSRIVNFMKSLADMKIPLPTARRQTLKILPPQERLENGIQLLGRFLADGLIRGVGPGGEIFEHRTATELTRRFITALGAVKIRGTH